MAQAEEAAYGLGIALPVRMHEQMIIRGAAALLLWVLCHEATPVHTAMRNCTRDEGGPFEVDNQVLISSHRKLLSSKATVVNVAEKSKRDFDRYD
ncbi:MAG: hypothetical protein WAM63_21400 [Rhodomicrobium sp.]